MTLHVRRHPSVADDILDAAAHIALDHFETALRFMDAVEIAIKLLRDRPKLGSLRDFDDPRLAKLRSYPIKRFRNFLILYEIDPDGIYIVAVTHGGRDLPRVLTSRF